MCFCACAVLTQLFFEFGKQLTCEVNNYNEHWVNPSSCPLPGDVIPGVEEYSSNKDY